VRQRERERERERERDKESETKREREREGEIKDRFLPPPCLLLNGHIESLTLRDLFF
jgi:hypothetical protein